VSFNKRYRGDWLKYTHNPILKNSVNKYGVDNFDFEIIEDNVKDIDELNKLEIKYAEKYNTYRPNGYNIRGCGDNKFVDDELKKHLSTFRIGTSYKPNNKMSSKYKGVYWKESKKSWMCRFDNNLISKIKFTNSEIEAAETYDKVALYLIGIHCFINFGETREMFFLKQKKKEKMVISKTIVNY